MNLNRNTLRRMILNEIKNLTERDSVVGNVVAQCANKLGRLGMVAAQGNMSEFKKVRDELIELKSENKKVGEILVDFDKKLAGAYYFSYQDATDDQLMNKFNINKKQSRDKIKDMIEKCN
jgi:hypothetical protein